MRQFRDSGRIAELATRHELHPNLITQWKRQAIEKLAKVFDDKGFEIRTKRDAEVTNLHAKIERLWRSLKYECVFLNAFETGSETRAGIGRWIDYRPTALGPRRPDA